MLFVKSLTTFDRILSIIMMSVITSVDKCTGGMTRAQSPLFRYSSAKALGTKRGKSFNDKCMRMLLRYRNSIYGRDVGAPGQGSRTYSMRARNGTRRDFLGTRHSLLSQFILPDQCLYIVKSMSMYTYVLLHRDRI